MVPLSDSAHLCALLCRLLPPWRGKAGIGRRVKGEGIEEGETFPEITLGAGQAGPLPGAGNAQIPSTMANWPPRSTCAKWRLFMVSVCCSVLSLPL